MDIPYIYSIATQDIKSDDIPIASVRNAKPSIIPTYPRSGNIHIFAGRGG
jgi:hypothetical protein